MNPTVIVDEEPTAETLRKVYERANADGTPGPGAATTLYVDGETQDIDLSAKAPARAPGPTKAQMRQAVLDQLRKTGLNRHGRRALLAQVKRQARR